MLSAKGKQLYLRPIWMLPTALAEGTAGAGAGSVGGGRAGSVGGSRAGAGAATVMPTGGRH